MSSYFKNAVGGAMMFLLLAGCGTTDEIPEADQPDPDTEEAVADEPAERDLDDIFADPEEEKEEVKKEVPQPKVDIDFRSYRSSLRDQYAKVQTSVPEVYLEVEEEEEREISNSGFRVQIASTRDVNKADEIEARFKEWAEEMDFEVMPEVYIIFRQPNYRVQVGDFLRRPDALRFSEIVRQEFDDAWVIRDRINPRIILQTSEEKEDVRYDELLDKLEEEELDEADDHTDVDEVDSRHDPVD